MGRLESLKSQWQKDNEGVSSRYQGLTNALFIVDVAQKNEVYDTLDEIGIDFRHMGAVTEEGERVLFNVHFSQGLKNDLVSRLKTAGVIKEDDISFSDLGSTQSSPSGHSDRSGPKL